MIAVGLLSGVTLGLCAAPLWMMLQLPTRVNDILKINSMRLSAVALAIGSVLGSLTFSVYFPAFMGMLVLLVSGIFVGMLAAALVEALEVIPVLFDRLTITADMRYAALAMAIGKTIGALIAGLLGV